MNKITNREMLLYITSELDISIIQENIECIQAFVESMHFEVLLKLYVDGYKQLDHKISKTAEINLWVETFLVTLPYLCFVPYKIVISNPYLHDIIKKSNLSHLFCTLDDIFNHMKDVHEVGPYIVDLRILNAHIFLIVPWYFMNSLMDALGLSRYSSIKKENKLIDQTIKPLDNIKKSLNDNIRLVNNKLKNGEKIKGHKQSGSELLSQLISEHAAQLKVENFNIKKVLSEIGSVTHGLISESNRYLKIFVMYKPSRKDKRNLYDKLFYFYKLCRPDDVQFATLESRLVGIENDPKLVRKETSKFYEALTRKMNRYFGIEFLSLE